MRPALRSIQKATARKASEKNTGLQPVSSTQFGMTRSRAAHNMIQNKSLSPEPSASPAGEPISTPASPAEFSIDALSPRQQRAVLVCDVVESVRWMEHDEDNAITRWSQFAAKVRASIAPEHQGRVVKSTGDGLMIEFESPPQAVAAAHALQKLAQEGNQRLAPQDPERQMHLRIGIHQAQIRSDSHDIYGHGVNLAARITTLAGPGEIIVTPEVRDHLTDSLDGDIEDMGECYLKHLSEPQRVYRVGQPSIAPILKPIGDINEPLFPTIAVIPFLHMETNVNDHLLGNLIADGVIAQLSKTEGLKVLSRLSTAKVARQSLGLETIDRLLNAKFMLTGSYHLNQSRLVYVIELCEVKSNHVIWADRLSGDLADLFSPQSQTIKQISDSVHKAIFEKATQIALYTPLPNLDSYSIFLSSIQLMHNSKNEGFQKSRQALDFLIERHPSSSIALAWRAKWNVLRVTRGLGGKKLTEADYALFQTQKALNLTPRNALALAVEGFVYCHLRDDIKTAHQCLAAALESDPSCSLAWLFMATVQGYRENTADAVRCARKATELSPIDPMSYYYDCLLGSALLYDGKFQSAYDASKSSWRKNRFHAPNVRLLIISCIELGFETEARELMLHLRKLEPELTATKYLAASPMLNAVRQRSAQALIEAGLPA
jgi:adenylate cyclase